MGKSFLREKICASHSWKYVSTTGKTSFYRQKYVFPLKEDVRKKYLQRQKYVFPLVGNAFPPLKKLCVSSNWKYLSITGKTIFTGKTMCFHQWGKCFHHWKSIGLYFFKTCFFQQQYKLSLTTTLNSSNSGKNSLTGKNVGFRQ